MSAPLANDVAPRKVDLDELPEAEREALALGPVEDFPQGADVPPPDVPPVEEEPSLHFALLADLAKRNGLDRLSMGMSGDYETAVAFGATHVRVGTAIFGVRPQPTSKM